MTDKLSENAQSALIANPNNGNPKTAVDRELFEAGLIGERGGLTRAGGIARQRLVQEREDRMFG
jgi:hypothetical protein